MRRVWLLHFVVLGCLMGVYLARYWSVELVSVGMLLLFVFLVSIKLPRIIPLAFLLVGVGLGVMRSYPILEGYGHLEAGIGQKVEIVATVITDPVYHNSGQFELNANHLRYQNRDIDATIRVRAFTNDIKRGDRILVRGKLRGGFASWQASVYYAEVDILSRDTSIINTGRSQFIANSYSAMPDPEASLGIGFLMGIRALLPAELEDQLAITGLTHIVAVSGYNLTILANTAQRLFSRFSRYQTVVLTGLLLASFVSVTGLSPSILRAVVVSGLSLGAWYYGRRISPWTLLLYSSSLSAMLQPAYAWFNIGWYLSLTAFFGVLVLAPLIQRRIMAEREPGLVGQIMIETTSAQLCTMPIIMLVFGQVSLIALVANVLVLPLIPLSMLTTFFTGLAYFINLQVATLFAFPSYIILQFITSVIGILSRLSWSLVEVNISIWQMAAMYGLVMVAYLALRKKHKERLV